MSLMRSVFLAASNSRFLREHATDVGFIRAAVKKFMPGEDAQSALDAAKALGDGAVLTRLGENSKMIITGDPSQIDLPPGMTSGLEEAVRLLADVPDITAVRFANADVVL